MGSKKWQKAKMALGLNLCVYVPKTVEADDRDPTPPPASGRLSNDVEDPSLVGRASFRPTTPTPSSSGLRLSIGGHKHIPKKTCAICLDSMKPGQGHAIFTAECSHSFHFNCITSSVKHGNQSCPVCRAKWKEIPSRNSGPVRSNGAADMQWPRADAWMTVVGQLRRPHRNVNRQISSPSYAPEPNVFDDDEVLDRQPEIYKKHPSTDDVVSAGKIEVRVYPEVSAVPKSTSHANFAVLIHLKAPLATGGENSCRNSYNLAPMTNNFQAPVDLVTALDVSGSMAGTKLAQLKRAMGFVVQNLSPSDRLSVIAFSSTARRLFPLTRMTEAGKQLALQAVSALTSNGGTNIAEGLRKGAKVLTDRKWKNPVSSIILLSDGQDTYNNVSSHGSIHPQDGHDQSHHQTPIPLDTPPTSSLGVQVPVYAFGFGADHDAAAMHSIAQASGGTFSFVESESVIQDAFAQCIGGLLSVVVQELEVGIECVDPSLKLGSIRAGNYRTRVTGSGRMGFVDGGDLYAEEERDFLVTIDVPANATGNEMSLLKVRCAYRDPVTQKMVSQEEADGVAIERSDEKGELVVSMEVDRQRNRLRAADAMAEARGMAEGGDLGGGVAVLESCRKWLSETVSGKAGDGLWVGLDAELKVMKERMANHEAYEASGRAYVLSGLSSHAWQRATARGDSSGGGRLAQAYQTPSMVNMVTRSQTTALGEPRGQIRTRTARPRPR